jgi:hypothetical protein
LQHFPRLVVLVLAVLVSSVACQLLLSIFLGDPQKLLVFACPKVHKWCSPFVGGATVLVPAFAAMVQSDCERCLPEANHTLKDLKMLFSTT